MITKLISEWFIATFSSESSPEERKRFAAAMWRIVVAANIFWAWGLLGPQSGFATNEDVDKQVARALSPYVTKLDRVSDQLEKDVKEHRKALVRSTTIEIRNLQQDCMASKPGSSVRARLSLEIDMKQQEYISLTGREYPVSVKCE